MQLSTTLIAGPSNSIVGYAEKTSLCSLRERFFTDPANTDLSPLRPVIARSWQRSMLLNVDPEKAMAAVAESQLDEQFLRLAGPVLSDLERLCVDSNACVCVTDAMGTIAAFRGTPEIVRWAEKIFPTSGGCMSEDLIGTNSEGTAIEEGHAVQVWGAEHFNKALQEYYCTSVPIRDPLRGSIRAVLSLTLPERVAIALDPRAVMLIVQGAAAEIGRLLFAHLATREQALLSEYLRETRKRGGEAVVAMDGRTTIASRGAMQLLGQSDYAVLAAYAQEATQRNKPSEHQVRSGSDRLLQLQVRPVIAGDMTAGTIMRLREHKSQPKQLRNSTIHARQDHFSQFVGESLALRRAIEGGYTASAKRMNAYVVGEAGTGKRKLAESLAQQLADDIATYCCSTADPDTAPSIETIEQDLSQGRALVLHHAEELSKDVRDRLTDLLLGTDRAHIMLTFKKMTDELLPLISALQGVEIKMPSLRTRREDIPQLVNHFLGALDAPRRASARLIQMLAAAEWPGNVRQLREVVAAAALRSSGWELKIDDLADLHRRALARSRLSRLQQAELEQIREALAEAGGNRFRAAAILRIGRSTLYRKIESYTTRGFDVEVS